MGNRMSLFICMFLLLSSNKSLENNVKLPPKKPKAEKVISESQKSTNECILAANKAISEYYKSWESTEEKRMALK